MNDTLSTVVFAQLWLIWKPIILPVVWFSLFAEEEYSLLSNLPEANKVDEESDEFQNVVKSFYETIQEYHSKIRIIQVNRKEIRSVFTSSCGASVNRNVSLQVEKLTNRLLHNQYKLKKASILQRTAYPIVERTLYHGTSETSVKEICVHGFNRSFCGKNGTFPTPAPPHSVRLSFTLLTAGVFVCCSDCLRSGRVLCRQLSTLGPGSVLTPECRRTQVCFCLQGSDRRLHQGLPFHENSTAQGDGRRAAQIRQCDWWHHQTLNVRHLQRHTSCSWISHHVSEDSPLRRTDLKMMGLKKWLLSCSCLDLISALNSQGLMCWSEELAFSEFGSKHQGFLLTLLSAFTTQVKFSKQKLKKLTLGAHFYLDFSKLPFQFCNFTSLS